MCGRMGVGVGLLLMVLLASSHAVTRSVERRGRGATIHVATAGSDSTGDGSAARPFRTPARAQTAGRATAAGGGAGYSVIIEAGSYYLNQTLSLTAADSASSWLAAGPVVLSAGQPLPHAGVTVDDPAVAAQLTPAAAAAVKVVDLRAAGITDYGAFSSRGSPNADAHLEMHAPMIAPSGLELFWSTPGDDGAGVDVAGESRAEYAGYPESASGANLLFTSMGALVNGTPPTEPAFALEPAAAAASSKWLPQFRSASPDVWAHGFWEWRWADAHYAVKNLTQAGAANVTMHMAGLTPKLPKLPCSELVCCGDCSIGPGIQMGTGAGKFFLYNLLAELDAPNEAYLNRSDGRLFFIPPTPTARGTISMLDHVVSIEGATGITLSGLTLKHSRGIALNVRGSWNVAVRSGGVHATGSTAVNISGGGGCIIDSLTVSGSGDSGVLLDGGDRNTLKPSGHILRNSSISSTNYYVWSNAPNVFLGKETPFLRHVYIKCIILPRQARDKHRESTQKKSGVSLGGVGQRGGERAVPVDSPSCVGAGE